MNAKYLYLTVNFLSILFPFAFSFYPKANFSKKWKYLWVAILVPAFIFILWDIAFTRLGIWGFNPAYLSGIYVGNMPIEEILFFICIPYACVFTYEASKHLIKTNFVDTRPQKIISIVMTIACFIVAWLNLDKWYTCLTFFGLGIYVLYLHINNAPFLGRFYLTYLVILIPFFIVNGILTGTFTTDPVVWYNDEENLGIRIGRIPVEDIFYGLFLIMMNVSIFEWLQKKRTS